MKIALLHGGESLIPGEGVPAGWKIYNFKITQSGWSSFNLPYSAFATPGRYLAEMARRLERDGPAKDVLLFNPWLELRRSDVALVLRHMRQAGDAPRIINNRDGIPVAYRLAANGIPELGRLALLSCVDAGLDAQLLGVLLDRPVPNISDAALDTCSTVGNGYSPHQSLQRILRWMAEHALATMTVHLRLGKDIPPVFAVLPYHAGDLLFFSLAQRRISVPFITGIVVARGFEDIVKAVSPSLPYRVIELVRTRSDGDIAWENRQFDAIRSQLADDLLYYYCRPLRPYDAAEYHLLDQYAFAAGHDGCSSLVREEGSVCSACTDTSVLLHFDGGWPLKVYPHPWRQRLIELLVGRGYNVTTLTDAPEAEHATHRNVRFTNLCTLKKLIEQHAVLIGMDSFPCHYAAHVLGTPTICLFACTQPSNSDAPASPRYAALEMRLPCRPCGAYATCPRDGGSECDNFVAPERVMEALDKIQNKQGM